MQKTHIHMTESGGYMYEDSTISRPVKVLNIHHHVVLNPVYHRATKEKGVTIDCRGIDYQT